jgi:hypothetical protein
MVYGNARLPTLASHRPRRHHEQYWPAEIFFLSSNFYLSRSSRDQRPEKADTLSACLFAKEPLYFFFF